MDQTNRGYVNSRILLRRFPYNGNAPPSNLTTAHPEKTVALPEGVKTALDMMISAAALSWNVLSCLAETAWDLVSGRQLPEPDLKSVAEAPEPGAVSRVPPRVIPRTSRSTVRRDKVA